MGSSNAAGGLSAGCSDVRERIGIFGGTFDPPHLGHLAAARSCARRLGLDRVIWVPNGIPPHKVAQLVSPARLRLEMTRAAIAEDANFEVSEIETRRSGPSFTIDTVRELRSLHPEDELFFILGRDQLESFPTWEGSKEILGLVTIVEVPRFCSSPEPGWRDAPAAGIVRVPFEPVDLSSRGVRADYAARGKLLDVAPSVRKVIERTGLYTMPAPDGPQNLDGVTAWGGALGFLIRPPHFIALRGEVGAGKSVLARSLGAGLGVDRAMPSPTFNLVHRYDAAGGTGVIHVDLYRLESADELWELGWAELGQVHETVMVEWPERAGEHMPRDYWTIEIGSRSGDPPDSRRIRVGRIGAPPPLAGLGAGGRSPLEAADRRPRTRVGGLAGELGQGAR